jgi:CheY-like chemotaxis protein
MTDNLNRKKILVVDDEISVRRLIRETLCKNYDVIEAQNGEEAVEISRSQKPDVIVIDMIMPRMDGITACSAIKKEETTAGIPIVMLTAIDHYLNRKLAESAAGVDVYMTKPFNPHDLFLTVTGLIDGGTANALPTDTPLNVEIKR